MVLVALALAWAYLSMRAVMGAGGSCGSGGPYEISRPCPDGAWLISIAIPMLLGTAMLGSALATGLSAPNLLLPMWCLLFGSLGWNFLDFGLFRGDVEVGWIVCGVVFELMALPALFLIRPSLGTRATLPGVPRLRWWVGCYLGLALVGASLGVWTYTLAAS